MILVLTLAFCGFVIIIAAIYSLNGKMKDNDYNKRTYCQNKVNHYDTTIYYEQSVEIAQKIETYKTNFTYHPTTELAANEIEFIDNTNNMILKISKVSCYSDMNVKNYQGYLYSIIKDYVVLKNYTSLDECIRDYQQNYCLFEKKNKIADRLKSLQEDF